MLVDNFNRHIDYVRIAVTDKCNLRCFYCMPEEGIAFVKRENLLTYEELLHLVQILVGNGIKKVRLTGGEPFLRKDIMSFIERLSGIKGLEKIAITTNGTLTEKYIDDLLSLGVNSFNLSIDSINKERFYQITRRDVFETVWSCFEKLKKADVDLKLNAVVMDGQNIEDLIPMVELTRSDDISVRFIEEMPFNGKGLDSKILKWDYIKIVDHIKSHFGQIVKLDDKRSSTSLNYRVNGFVGSFGVIPAYSRTFCGTCNRIRITPTGILKTCLYDNGVFNVKDLMRNGASDLQITEAIKSAISHKEKDGFEAEINRGKSDPISESMATIGG